ncbi:hypothetical protein [Paludibaculum fermentans]|uniref:Uncharacterized protein n=1 Tax=Paludibaculum fermentans TaxID=1473598 RepID=A0A7S7SL00_PALFE|nr:hypothetical protein [Paludibaculum fermentans]QOY88869.1 hypothetical protein IRI77_02595 [Paludibaculum fermentans]
MPARLVFWLLSRKYSRASAELACRSCLVDGRGKQGQQPPGIKCSLEGTGLQRQPVIHALAVSVEDVGGSPAWNERVAHPGYMEIIRNLSAAVVIGNPNRTAGLERLEGRAIWDPLHLTSSP